jgi:hypothetical protein
LTDPLFSLILDRVRVIKLRALIFVFVLLLAGGIVSAEEAPIPFRFSLGWGVEGNKNTKEIAAITGVFTTGFALNARFSIGTRLGFSHNLSDLGTLEAGIMFRVYFLLQNSSGPFVQADGGVSHIFWRNDAHDDMFTKFLYGGTLGWRFRLGSVYFEPYGRGGYPFIWGGGLVMGFSL